MAISTLFSMSSVLFSVWVFDLINVVLQTDEDITAFVETRLGQVLLDSAQGLSLAATLTAAVAYAIGVASVLNRNVIFLMVACATLVVGFLSLFLGGGFVVAFRIVYERITSTAEVDKKVVPVRNAAIAPAPPDNVDIV